MRSRSGAGLAGAALAAGIAVLAWWATGLRPFSSTCYLAVALTAAAVAVVDLAGPWHREAPLAPVPRRCIAPWIVLLGVAVVLEAVGLGLGGRSSAVPTLSTVVDHALSAHVGRFVLFLAWVLVGLAPAVRARTGSLRP